MTTNVWTPAHLIGWCLAHTLRFAVGLLHLSPVLIAMGLNMPGNMSLGQHLLMHQWSCGIRVTFTVLPPPSPDNEGLLLHCCHCHNFGLLGAHWRNWGTFCPWQAPHDHSLQALAEFLVHHSWKSIVWPCPGNILGSCILWLMPLHMKHWTPSPLLQDVVDRTATCSDSRASCSISSSTASGLLNTAET